MNVGESLIKLCQDSGIYALFSDPKPLIMIAIACVLMYLAVVKKYEPLLLMPIAFGMLLTNLPIAGMYNQELFAGGHTNWSLFGGAVLLDSSALTNPVAYTFTAQGAVMDAAGNMLGQIVDAITAGGAFNAAGALVAADGSILANSAQIIISSAGAYLADGQVFTVSGQLLATAGKVITPGMLDYLYLGVKLGIYPCLIFLGVGCMTDFGPLIANPKSLLLGAAAQLGIFITFIVCYTVMGFTPQEAASIGIIGGADGPTAIYLTGKLAPHLLGPIAVAAYSYMALVPVIQPPIMRALTTKKEREIVMEQLRPVSKREKIIFPIAVTIIVSLLLPSAAPLVGCLMLGNLFREMRRGGPSEQDRSERADEHRHHLPGHHGRRDGDRLHLPVVQDAGHHRRGRARLRLWHRGRRAAGQAHEQALRRQDQPAHRFRRRVRRADGRACEPGGGPEGQPRQLPAHARHGPQRGRRDRLGHRRRYPAEHVRLIAI